MLSANNQTRKKAPQGPFSLIADAILGPKYDLSLVFCGDTLSRRLNREFRHQDKIANILSFPYDKKTGEIFLNLGRATSEAVKFNHSGRQHTLFLFIHGCLHLKGFAHGVRMESEERKIFKRFLTN